MAERAFSYDIPERPTSGAADLSALLGEHLEELLALMIPTSAGRDVVVDGFRLLNDRETVRPLPRAGDTPGLDEPAPLNLYEPRLGYIQRLLASLLEVVELEAAGQKVRPDRFRLKNLASWLVPMGGATDVLAHASSRCNLHCRFCYNAGTSPLLKPWARDPELEYEEIRLRTAHYVPSSGLGIFPNMGSPCESLAHPRALEILQGLRNKTDELIRVSSNGSTLARETIERLAELQPIYLDVSLNSASAERRAWLMGDPHPETTYQALPLLKEAGLPYGVVIVPWPFPSRKAMLEDLARTVALAAAHDPAVIQISLPGYTRAKCDRPLFPHPEVWEELREKTLALRETVDCPLVLRPGLFEEYQTPEAVREARVIGVVRGSPLARAGLEPGDRILKVNGLPARGRTQARVLLATLAGSDLASAALLVDRRGKSFGLTVKLKDHGYPYTPASGTLLGAVFPSAGIPASWFEELRRVILEHGAKKVLLLTSALVRPCLERYGCEAGLPADVAVDLRVPENRYFGGNIFMGDLLVVQDFIQAVEAYLAEPGQSRPDLVLVPSSPFGLSGWGRDLEGRTHLEIERRLAIPAALVECDPLFD
jgi:pyruvate-formate lyase-activating enzyme